MFLENVGIDARDPRLVGRFWESLLGCEPLTDEPDIYETRLDLDGRFYLDLCLPKVDHALTPEPRLHVDLLGGDEQAQVVQRALDLGARRLDIGQGHVPWVVLADPEGNPFCVMEERAVYTGTGPIAALVLESADPDRDAALWGSITGWTDAEGVAPRTLRHPSRRGPLLELTPERGPKAVPKNPWHLDVRLEAGDDADEVAERITGLGGRELDHGWGDLPWRVYQDTSGNELCVLPHHP
jgi:predicted enzyme related to lactoylglutathione lyase